MKLGRGSGQWTFADRTPSPENEAEADVFGSQSPSRRPAAQAAQLGPDMPEQQGAGYIDAEETIEGKRMREHEEVAEAETLKSDIVPPSPPPTIVGSSEDGGGHRPLQQVGAGIGDFHSISSKASSSESEQALTSPVDNRSAIGSNDDVASIGPLTDFGLDGATLSRAKALSNKIPSIRNGADKPEQVRDDTEDQYSIKTTVNQTPDRDTKQRHEEVDRDSVTVPEPAHHFQLPDEHLSTPAEGPEYDGQATQQLQGGHLPSTDRLESGQPKDRSFVELSDILSDAEIHRSVNDVNVEKKEEEEGKEEREEDQANAGEAPPNERLPSETLTKGEVVAQEADLQAPVHEEGEKGTGASLESNLPGEQIGLSQVMKTIENEMEAIVRPSEVKGNKVEIVDLESDDEEAAQSHHLSSPPSNYRPSTPLDIDNTKNPRDRMEKQSASTETTTKGIQSPDTQAFNPSIAKEVNESSFNSDTDKTETVQQQDSASPIPEANMSTQVKVQDVVTLLPKAEINSRPQPQIEMNMPSKREELSHLRPMDDVPAAIGDRKSRSQSSVNTVAHIDRAEANIEKMSRESSTELPSTVPDSILEASRKTQLLTPDATQPRSFTSQPSSSIQSAIGDDTLPTPRLSQGDPAVVSVATTPLLQQEPSLVSGAGPSEKNDLKGAGKIEGELSPTVQKAPTLIQKLKAMRKLASQTPQKVGDVNPASPWFEAKRSSQMVPDSEAESEVENLSEGDRKHSRLDSTSQPRTPENRKSLATSFIRSPFQGEVTTSVPSSPVYLPPSQPPPPGFRTSLSYFVPLATLQSHFTMSVDVLAIGLAATKVTRSTSGPRDFNQTIWITDPSSNSSKTSITTVQIFRSHGNSFPMLEVGDALLLRDFKVQSFQRKLFLLSTHSSAWAVFRQDTDVQVRGPPVEFGAEERGFARGLWRWWVGLSHLAKEGLDQAVLKDQESKVTAGSKSSGKVKKENQQANGIVKHETIEGLGVDLPGSQGKSRKASLKNKLENEIMQTTESPKRILRSRGARAKPERSESPIKGTKQRSGSITMDRKGEFKSG